MKIRRWDRIFCAVIALCALLGIAAVAAEGFFGIPVLTKTASVIARKEIVSVLLMLVLLLLLLAVFLGCLSITFRHRNKKATATQKTDAGVLTISVPAIEGLVEKCVHTHDELNLKELHVANKPGSHGGLIVDLLIETGASASIPLMVDALQKEVQNYLTETTGLAVKEIRVMVDNADALVAASPFDLNGSVPVERRPREPKVLPTGTVVPNLVEHQGEEEKTEQAEGTAEPAAEETGTEEAAAEEKTDEVPEESAEDMFVDADADAEDLLLTADEAAEDEPAAEKEIEEETEENRNRMEND